MTSLGTITHDGFLHVLFPVADCDLDDLLFEKSKAPKIHRDGAALLAMANEISCLAEALDYLHHELHTENGDQFVCIHHDLKPDNILVVLEHRDFPVGRWKITDFGLSRLKQIREDDRSGPGFAFEHAPSVRASLVPPSMTTPKRHPGAFQAPEIEKKGQKVVGPGSDVWSLGCIWILVLAYMVGGKQRVEEFERRRQRERKTNERSNSYWNDYFYRDGGRQVNLEVIDWLRELRELRPKEDDWVKNGIRIALSMLKIDPSKRSSAREVKDALFGEVVQRLKNDPEEPSTANSQTSIPQPHPGSGAVPGELDTLGTLSDSPGGASSALQGTSTDSENPMGSRPDSSLQQTVSPPERPISPVFTPYPSHTLQRPTCESTFVNIRTSDARVIRTAFSSSNLYVAFLSKFNVYVHSVTRLDQDHLWAKKRNDGKVLSESDDLTIPVTEGYQWRSMAFSNDFLAVRGSQAESTQCVVCSDHCFFFCHGRE